jgi:hypothetical protein
MYANCAVGSSVQYSLHNYFHLTLMLLEFVCPLFNDTVLTLDIFNIIELGETEKEVKVLCSQREWEK